MRQIFSVRFFAAVGAVVGLLFLLTTIFATRSAIDDAVGDDAEPAPVLRAINLVEHVEITRPTRIDLDADGLTVADVRVTIDRTRAVTISKGTPGEVHCRGLAIADRCAVVLDLLGEAVVWFAVVPGGPNPETVPLPAIDTLDQGVATLVNGWQLPYASVLDRRCGQGGDDEEFSSYREFRDALGDDFTSIFDVADQRLVAVVCRQRVPYAPEIAAPTTVPATTVTGSTVPDTAVTGTSAP